MVSKITATLAIVLIIGFINKSHADDDVDVDYTPEFVKGNDNHGGVYGIKLHDRNKKEDKMNAGNSVNKNKLRCYVGTEINPKGGLKFSLATLSDCYNSTETSCVKTTVLAGNTVVTRSCSFVSHEEKCQTIYSDVTGETETCYCNDKDGFYFFTHIK
ncbi:uncharacterized protein LOC122847471 [Aphidius gifuensis]|uniref:uncharacterized protein LOC122847471 n=1 Tax=Aphidius gifuensis TaxID=684658 RepID=UPI001CDC2545|nr:uncharacterized protein LOC122847471 [Aphidius gifuensis]